MVTRRRMLMVPPAAAAAAIVRRARARRTRAGRSRRPRRSPSTAGRGSARRTTPTCATRWSRATRSCRWRPTPRRRRRSKQARRALPEPFWDGHASAIACTDKAWKLAFANLRRPEPASGFVARFIDPAFNDCIFMWDSCFMTLFGRYGARAFPFVRTLDNFYAKQHPDGFICREIGRALGDDRFPRFDPSSTGPNVMAWAEWEHYRNFGDRDRLARVFPALRAYHQWLRAYRTWPDGSLLVDGLGMRDGQPAAPAHRHALRRPGALPRAHDLGGRDAAADPVGAPARARWGARWARTRRSPTCARRRCAWAAS